MKESFTLIELIVVIAIIAILAAIIAPNAFRAIEKAKIAKLISEGKTYKTALMSLYVDTGHWPADDTPTGSRVIYLADPSQLPVGIWTGLGVTLHPSNLFQNDDAWLGWDGPYVENLQGEHPWGGCYFLQRWDGLGDFLFLNIHSMCYPGDSTYSSFPCGTPSSSAEKIDQQIDNGDTSWESGMFFQWNGAEPDSYFWMLVLTN